MIIVVPFCERALVPRKRNLKWKELFLMKKSAVLTVILMAICATVIGLGIKGRQSTPHNETSAISPVAMPETTDIKITNDKTDDNLIPAKLFYGFDYLPAVFDWTVENGGCIVERKFDRDLVLYEDGEIKRIPAEMTSICTDTNWLMVIKNPETGEILKECAYQSADLDLTNYLHGSSGESALLKTRASVQKDDCELSKSATIYYVKDKNDDDIKIFTVWSEHKKLYEWKINDPATLSYYVIENYTGFIVWGEGGVFFLGYDGSTKTLLSATDGEKLYSCHGIIDGHEMLISSTVGDGVVNYLIYDLGTGKYETGTKEGRFVSASCNFIIEECDDGYYGWFFKDASLEPIDTKLEIPEDKQFNLKASAEYCKSRQFQNFGFSAKDTELFSTREETPRITCRYISSPTEWQRIPDDCDVVFLVNYSSSKRDNVILKKIHDSIGNFVTFGRHDVMVNDFHYYTVEGIGDPAKGECLSAWRDPYGELEKLRIYDILDVDDGTHLVIEDRQEQPYVIHLMKDGNLVTSWETNDSHARRTGKTYTSDSCIAKRVGDGIVAYNGYDAAIPHWSVLHKDGTIEILDYDPAPDTTKTPLKSGVSLLP